MSFLGIGPKPWNYWAKELVKNIKLFQILLNLSQDWSGHPRKKMHTDMEETLKRFGKLYVHMSGGQPEFPPQKVIEEAWDVVWGIAVLSHSVDMDWGQPGSRLTRKLIDQEVDWNMMPSSERLPEHWYDLKCKHQVNRPCVGGNGCRKVRSTIRNAWVRIEYAAVGQCHILIPLQSSSPRTRPIEHLSKVFGCSLVGIVGVGSIPGLRGGARVVSKRHITPWHYRNFNYYKPWRLVRMLIYRLYH